MPGSIPDGESRHVAAEDIIVEPGMHEGGWGQGRQGESIGLPMRSGSLAAVAVVTGRTRHSGNPEGEGVVRGTEGESRQVTHSDPPTRAVTGEVCGTRA